ncbi:MAG: N-acetylmuramoyl-L-alanine amidase, partial [Vicinamibacterales bacterium]
MSRHLIALVAVAAVAWAAGSAARAQAPGATLTVLAQDGRRAMPVTAVGGRDYVALDDVATTFGVDVRDDRLAGGVSVTAGGTTILLTESQAVVSVGGRLVSLPAPPVRQGGRWLVPVDFLVRALGPALGTRYDYRRPTRLLVAGDLSVPRVVARLTASDAGATVTFDISPAATARVTPENGRLVVAVAQADALDATLPAIPAQGFVQGLSLADTPGTLQIATGPRYASYRASTSQPDAGSTRLTVELRGAAPPTAAPAPGTPEPAPAPAPTPPPAPDAGLPPASLLGGDEPGIRTIVIDPGHGGDETGTTGPGGTLEKNVTLAVARRLRTLIESRLGLNVYLTREDDRTLSLDDRTAFANSHRADVFLSIHANAAV